jgi:hypothetical protein
MNSRINVEFLKKYNSAKDFFVDKQISFMDKTNGGSEVNEAITSALTRGKKCFVIDGGGDYRHLCKLLGGKLYELTEPNFSLDIENDFTVFNIDKVDEKLKGGVVCSLFERLIEYVGNRKFEQEVLIVGNKTAEHAARFSRKCFGTTTPATSCLDYYMEGVA